MQPLQGPLSGQRVVVTRPEGQAEGLLVGLRALGAHALHIPFLAIAPLQNYAALAQIAQQLLYYKACLFISANAVHMAWPTLVGAGKWPQALVAAAVGPGTAAALKALDVQSVILPEAQFDSEGLLAHPFFAPEHCLGQRFALIRGEGGRDTLAQTLRQRGARVDEATTYQRTLHPGAVLAVQSLLTTAKPALWIVTSSESLTRLLTAMPLDLVQTLQQQTLVVPHARIAAAARALGFLRVIETQGGDAGILAFMQTYNEQTQPD